MDSQPEREHREWRSPSRSSSDTSFESGASFSPEKGKRKRTEEEIDPDYDPRTKVLAVWE